MDILKELREARGGATAYGPNGESLGSLYELAAQRIEAAQEMRAAIDRMELVLMGFDALTGLPESWGEPRHRGELGVTIKTDAETVYRVTDALAELNRIVHSPKYQF